MTLRQGLKRIINSNIMIRLNAHYGLGVGTPFIYLKGDLIKTWDEKFAKMHVMPDILIWTLMLYE